MGKECFNHTFNSILFTKELLKLRKVLFIIVKNWYNE